MNEELNPPPTEESDVDAHSKHSTAVAIINKGLSRDGKFYPYNEWEYFTCLTLGKYPPAEIKKLSYKEVVKTSLLLRINQYLQS